MSENEQTPKETVQVEQQQAADVVAVLQIMHHTMQEQVYLLTELNQRLNHPPLGQYFPQGGPPFGRHPSIQPLPYNATWSAVELTRVMNHLTTSPLDANVIITAALEVLSRCNAVIPNLVPSDLVTQTINTMQQALLSKAPLNPMNFCSKQSR